MTEDEIIEALKAKVRDAKPLTHPYWVNVPSAYPVVNTAALDRAEKTLGFALPPLLRRIYTEVGNGGPRIPPGLMGIACEDDPRRHPPTDEKRRDQDDCAAFHFSSGNNLPEFWPHAMLMFCEWGCIMWSCVLCKEDHPVYFFDGNENVSLDDADAADDLENMKVADLSRACWMKEADTLAQWFQRVIAGQPVGPDLKKIRAEGSTRD